LETRKIVILGSGPAGCTAALYTARADLEPLVFEGLQPGGQLTITTEVENFPGFPEGIMGPELVEIMKKQAERFKAEFIGDRVIEVDLGQRPFLIKGEEHQVKAKALIIATGASARRLGLPSEEKLMGYGVSACATCDGFFFRNKKVLVVGGGDSAMEEANFLTKFASQVKIIHRRDKFRASKFMSEKIKSNPKIDYILDSVVEEIIGEKEIGVQAVRYRNVKTGITSQEAFEGVFLAIGHNPNTEIFRGKLELDRNGYIVTRPGSSLTSVAGIFAAGDCQDHVYKQAVTAAGSGCMAALDAEKFLQEQY
jgi:thioredoxin reductase (NADPH)